MSRAPVPTPTTSPQLRQQTEPHAHGARRSNPFEQLRKQQGIGECRTSPRAAVGAVHKPWRRAGEREPSLQKNAERTPRASRIGTEGLQNGHGSGEALLRVSATGAGAAVEGARFTRNHDTRTATRDQGPILTSVHAGSKPPTRRTGYVRQHGVNGEVQRGDHFGGVGSRRAVLRPAVRPSHRLEKQEATPPGWLDCSQHPLRKLGAAVSPSRTRASAWLGDPNIAARTLRTARQRDEPCIVRGYGEITSALRRSIGHRR